MRKGGKMWGPWTHGGESGQGGRRRRPISRRPKTRAATKRAKARRKVMKQRKDHEAWVEQLAAVCDATNVEKQRLAAEIIFLEHNMDQKFHSWLF